MLKNKLFIFSILFLSLLILDQYIKSLFVNGFGIDGKCISLVLAYNKGVAFSMFAFLEGNLKYVQIGILSIGIIYLLFNKNVFYDYYIPTALLLAGGISNIYDRFIHEGVVDYVYWHCGFDFAIFNLADVLINISVALILYIGWQNEKKEKLAKKD
jgi:signal peptidase II